MTVTALKPLDSEADSLKYDSMGITWAAAEFKEDNKLKNDRRLAWWEHDKNTSKNDPDCSRMVPDDLGRTITSMPLMRSVADSQLVFKVNV